MEINIEDMKQYFKEIETEAKFIYWEIYGKAVGHKNFLGEPMPGWANLPENIRNAWIEVARDKDLSAKKLEKEIGVLKDKISELEEEKKFLKYEIAELE